MNRQWQLQEAKAKLSQLVKAAETSPQEITVHGKTTAVLISIKEYQKNTQIQSNRESLFELAARAGVNRLDLTIERATTADPERKVF
jgi:prevent-host-death family protein